MTARPLVAAFIHVGPETAFILNCAKPAWQRLWRSLAVLASNN